MSDDKKQTIKLNHIRDKGLLCVVYRHLFYLLIITVAACGPCCFDMFSSQFDVSFFVFSVVVFMDEFKHFRSFYLAPGHWIPAT